MRFEVDFSSEGTSCILLPSECSRCLGFRGKRRHQLISIQYRVLTQCRDFFFLEKYVAVVLLLSLRMSFKGPIINTCFIYSIAIVSFSV